MDAYSPCNPLAGWIQANDDLHQAILNPPAKAKPEAPAAIVQDGRLDGRELNRQLHRLEMWLESGSTRPSLELVRQMIMNLEQR